MINNLPEKIRVRLLKNVRGNPYIGPPGTIARQELEYEGHSNPNGAISAILPNGEKLGLYPEEFEFIEAPEWVLRIWAKHHPNIKCELR
jgi:hypothetical protein